jgi:hypothetical protein
VLGGKTLRPVEPVGGADDPASRDRPCGILSRRGIMALMRLRAACVLGLAILIVAPISVLADAPPASSTTAETGPVTEPPDTTGQVVTIFVPAEPTPPPKAATKRAKSTPPAPKTAGVTAPVARSRAVTPRVSTPTRTPSTRKPRSPSVHGGASKAVAEPPARGARSTVVAAGPAPPPLGAPAAPLVASVSRGTDVKPSDSTNWTVWLLVAVGVIELIVLSRFAYRRWSHRRSLRRAARNFTQASVRSAPKEPPYGRRPATKRWKP